MLLPNLLSQMLLRASCNGTTLSLQITPATAADNDKKTITMVQSCRLQEDLPLLFPGNTSTLQLCSGETKHISPASCSHARRSPGLGKEAGAGSHPDGHCGL
jgi:hypothetical protein